MLTEIRPGDQMINMHIVIPGVLIIQLGEDTELKVPWRQDLDMGWDDLDRDGDQAVDSKVISSAAPEKSGCPPGRKVGGVAF